VNSGRIYSSGLIPSICIFRLNTFYLHILPLRERKEDIPILARHFLSRFASKYNKKIIRDFSPETEKLLVSYSWPGNVRELRNLIERFVVLENAEIIQTKHLPMWLLDQQTTPLSTDRASDNKFILPESGISLENVEKDLILQALERSNHNKAEAARLLNVSYDTLRYQLKKFDLK
jgi:DNA-binding NtrC family response regulator